MSDSNYEFEEEAQDQATRNPVRARMRELEDRNKALEAQAKEAEAAKRELAFVKAGVNPESAAAKYFVKGYDGELSAEAIRAAAAEANLINDVTEVKQQVAEERAWGRVGEAYKTGETSEPVVDWPAKMSSAKNEQELKAYMAQYNAEQARNPITPQ